MEKKQKNLRDYALVVNIVCIIAILISVIILLSAIIDRSAPMYAGWHKEDLSSFEKYKLDVLSQTNEDGAYTPSDAELMKMYEAAKTEHVNRVLHDTFRTSLIAGLVLLVTLVIFIYHWKQYLIYRKDFEAGKKT